MLTPKQENFCLKYHETGNASEAYRLCYNAKKMKPETINRNAKALLDNNKIATRLKELQEVVVEKHNVTVGSILAELEEARIIALTYDDNGKAQPSAAVSASMGKAKLAGLLMDKVQHGSDPENPFSLLVSQINGSSFNPIGDDD